jgi:hypothetical protein
LYEAKQEIEKTIFDIRRDITAGITRGQTKQLITLSVADPAERVVDGYPTAISLHVDNSCNMNTVVQMPYAQNLMSPQHRMSLEFYNGSTYP